MAKRKNLIKTGILTGTIVFGAEKASVNFATEAPNSTTPKKEITLPKKDATQNLTNGISTPSPTKAVTSNLTKRLPQKVYHRFEEIPEIKDNEAFLYNKDEYTYIVDANHYQETGELSLKRVLKQEVTKANTLSIIYRSECHSYTPKPKEDQLYRYIVDLKLLNPTGIYKGPSQMDDEAIINFIKFLSISPEYRQYVLPIIKNTPEYLQKVEKKFFNNDTSKRSMEVREMMLSTKDYQKIKVNTSLWSTLASKELKRYISNKEQKLSKTSPASLTDTTKTYLVLTELFPSTDLMIKALEDYNLSTFALNRQGKPKHILTALALSLNLKDETGNLDATRIPTYAIAASLSHINWKGNGRIALRDAQNLRRTTPQNPQSKLKSMAKTWVSGKGNTHGINEISKLNIITEDIINQYLAIEMPGAKNFAAKYKEMVNTKEEILEKLSKQEEKSLASQKSTKESFASTLFLTLKDFIHQR